MQATTIRLGARLANAERAFWFGRTASTDFAIGTRSERRATMNGANAPTSNQIHLMNDAAPDQRTSTQKLSDMLDNLRVV
jgi:hypothetical protein